MRLVVSCAALLGAACRRSGAPAVVAVSIEPVADIVARVAGTDADVRRFPSRRLASEPNPALSGVTLAVRVGVGLDDWLEIAARGANPKVRSFAVADRVPTRAFSLPARAAGGAGDPHEDPARLDPYVWLDPRNMRLAAKAIGEELARVDAAHAGAYRFRAGEVDEALGAFDADTEGRLGACAPPPLVTDLPTLGYFAERYRIPIVAVLRPFGTAPTPSWLEGLVRGVAGIPRAVVVVTSAEVPEEARALGRPILHVPVLERPVEVAVGALVDALCPAGTAREVANPPVPGNTRR